MTMVSIINNIKQRIKFFISKLNEDNIGEYAAECAFFTILSFIPCIIFLMTLVAHINIDENTIFFIIKEFIPEEAYILVQDIIDEIYSKSAGTISISVLIALWSAGKGFFSLCKGFRKIYKVPNSSNKFFIRIEGVIYTFIFIVMFIIALLILVFGNSIQKLIDGKFYILSLISSYILKAKFLITIFVLFLIFAFLYKIVSNRKIKFKYQLPGALFSAFAWYITSYIFSIYVEVFRGFTNMYGSLSNIILIMMWVYFCMYIILIGAEINCVYFDRNNIKLLDSKNKI